MKNLREKFGKFAVSKEEMARVKGGLMAICFSKFADRDVIIAADTFLGLLDLSFDPDLEGCKLVQE